jgi:hypothetical protein
MNADELRRLPLENGFRLRGLSVTRTEAFTDAAFALKTARRASCRWASC